MTGRGPWTITLSGLRWLNSNQRPHPLEKARLTRAIREAAAEAARQVGLPGLGAALVLGYVHPTSRRRMDPANWWPSFKAALDGLVDAGVVPDDDHLHVSGPHMFRAHRVPAAPRGEPQGALTLVVAGLVRCRCGHDQVEHIRVCARPGCECETYQEVEVAVDG